MCVCVVDITLATRKTKTRGNTNEIRSKKERRYREHQTFWTLCLFNKEKCQFGNKQIEFFGHIFTKKRLKPSPDKVRAIKECRPGENKAVQSFLGMAGYLDSYISNYSSITAPLNQLTWKNTKFTWEKGEEKAFRKIQDSISNDRTMVFFEPSRPTVLCRKNANEILTKYSEILCETKFLQNSSNFPNAYCFS